MGFRGVWLTPGVAVNRRFRAGMHHDSQKSLAEKPLESHVKHCLIPGEWPPAATLQVSGTSPPIYQAMR